MGIAPLALLATVITPREVVIVAQVISHSKVPALATEKTKVSKQIRLRIVCLFYSNHGPGVVLPIHAAIFLSSLP
jgi:hypothetical protein